MKSSAQLAGFYKIVAARLFWLPYNNLNHDSFASVGTNLHFREKCVLNHHENLGTLPIQNKPEMWNLWRISDG